MAFNTLRPKTLHSLRHRYAWVSTLLALIVMTGASIAHFNVTALSEKTAANMEIRSQLLTHSRHTRDALWQARQALAAFLIDPNRPEHRERITAAIERAQQNVAELARHSSDFPEHDQPAITTLHDSIARLNAASKVIIATRLNAQQQYPSMALAQQSLLPINRDFYTAVALAMSEIEVERKEVSHSQVYQTLVQSRHLWTQMVSNFRMYLANRMGSFAEESLHTQEQDVELLYVELGHQFEVLRQLQHKGDLGLQTEDSLQEMSRLAQHWMLEFAAVKRLHASDAWRADVKQMKEIVEPLFAVLWDAMLSVDRAIEVHADHDIQSLTKTAQAQTQTLWIAASLGVVFIVIGFITLNRLMLQPLSRISHALNAEAKGLDNVELPLATTVETKDLLDAFAEMRNKVQARQMVLEYQALHDALTGLPNRSLLLDRLQHTILAAKRKNQSLALLMLDLDRFKEVNDTLGHDTGDRLLMEVGARLLDTVRDTDTIARLGGDEFCILLPESNIAAAQHIAGRILQSLEQSIEIETHQLLVGVSIGIAVYPEHGDTPQTLLQRADVAMYVAKRNKLGQALYTTESDQHSIKRLELTGDLREALARNELELHYQPKIEIASGAITWVEALLRWTHPRHGPIPPDQVIPLAEQTGLIRPLTRWVLNRALQQCAEWQQAGIDIHVAVNLSAYCLQDNDLGEWIKDWFDHHDLETRHLILEVTESAMMSDPKKAIQILNQLDTMGIHISIDDFGTGFSSLAYLKQLPIDELKIDKSFVLEMLNNENDAVIVRSTIDLAHNLGLRIVAEGVENQEMLDLLEILKCDYAQGYHISRPIPGKEFMTWWHSTKIYRIATHPPYAAATAL